MFFGFSAYILQIPAGCRTSDGITRIFQNMILFLILGVLSCRDCLPAMVLPLGSHLRSNGLAVAM
jgi:hypothetical protein